MKNKIKLSVGLMLSAITLFSFLSVPTPAFAMTCNSVTISGTVITGTPPAHARFEYGTDYNTIANGGGTTTVVQIFNTEGSFPIQQFVSGLSENTTYYYRLAVTNNYGAQNGSINNFTTPSCYTPVVQVPTVTLYASPSSIDYNEHSTLNWNSTNASYCSSSWSGSSSTSGSTTVYPSHTTTYNITCTSSTGQQASDSATVYVDQNQQYNNPTVNLYASNSNITSGQNSTLSWNSNNASYCSSSWSGSNSTSGSTIVYPSYTTTYRIICYGTNGQQVNDSETIYVNQNQQICQDVNANNYRALAPCSYTNYYQICQDVNAINYRSYSACTYAPVNNQPTVVVYSDQVNVPYNGSATIRWITTKATSCYANGGSVGWAGEKSIGPGSFYTGSLTESKTFSLTCSNNFGSVSDSETITVRNQTYPVSPKPTPTSFVLISSSVDRNQPIIPTIDNTRPKPGDEINYTVTYQNIGTGSITNLNLRINLPLEIDYISSSPNNPTISGNNLVFNLGTLKANGQGTVTIRTKVRENISAGTNLNFPATLSYTDPSGQNQSVNANVSAQISDGTENKNEIDTNNNILLGANVFGAGFLPTNMFGWLFLIILLLVLISLARYVFSQSFQKETRIVTEQPSGKKTTTTTVQ